MFVQMLETLATPAECYRSGELYDVTDSLGAAWLGAGVARETDQIPARVRSLANRLKIGAGKPCVFPPMLGEFGHLLLSHVPFVHHHPAARKTVCCRPGEAVLFPSANLIVHVRDEVPDAHRVATLRNVDFSWVDLQEQFPDHTLVPAGNLSADEELVPINPETRIPFQPLYRGLKCDVVLGVRHRAFAPERNWPWWRRLAIDLHDHGHTFAVIGDRATSFDVPGQVAHSGDYDTDAAVELLQNCRLYIGGDSGGSHLAAAVGARMLIFRETASGSRDLTPRMMISNPGRVDVMPPDAWGNPAAVVTAALERLSTWPTK